MRRFARAGRRRHFLVDPVEPGVDICAWPPGKAIRARSAEKLPSAWPPWRAALRPAVEGRMNRKRLGASAARGSSRLIFYSARSSRSMGLGIDGCDLPAGRRIGARRRRPGRPRQILDRQSLADRQPQPYAAARAGWVRKPRPTTTATDDRRQLSQEPLADHLLPIESRISGPRIVRHHLLAEGEKTIGRVPAAVATASTGQGAIARRARSRSGRRRRTGRRAKRAGSR